MELQGKKIVFLGDSITEGVGASSAETKYVSVLEKNCGLAAAYNHGISGTRFAKQKKPSENARWDLDFVSRVKELERDADAVVVFGGTNDFGHGDAPLGTFGDTSEDSFYGSCSVLMRSLIERYPDVPIIFLTPLHRTGETTLTNEIGLERVPLADYAEAIRKTANAYSLPVLDLYAMSGMQPEVEAQNRLYFADGLHPSDAGHRRIAELLENFMRHFIV